MSLLKSILSTLCQTEFHKAEDPEGYKKRAHTGTMVGHPVSIQGKTHRPDVQIPYHTTIKFFDKDDPKNIHSVASGLDLQPPKPEEVAIEPGQFKDINGNDVYVIKLHGPHAEKLKEHHDSFSNMGPQEGYEYQPHISVDKMTHDKIKQSGAKTAKEAGIQFHPAVLRQGNKELMTYKPKLAASENIVTDLKKGEIEEKLEETKNNETTNSLMNRFEDKFLVKREHLSLLATTFAERLKEGDIDTEVRYNTNQSIYLDNKDLDAFKEALEEISPRLKVRVRRYAPNDNDWENTAYVELKIKTEDGDTKKTRIRIREEMISNVVSGKPITLDEELININKDITKSTLEKRIKVINNVISKYGFKKQCVITYKRRAYSSKKIRVTIDDNVKYSEMGAVSEETEKSAKESDNWKEWDKKYTKARHKDFIIVEIKHENKVPEWVEELLDNVNAKKISFSKYCAAIMGHIADGKPSGNITRDIKLDVNNIINQIYPDKLDIVNFGKSENLEKGALKNALIAGTMAAASAMPQTATPSEHHGPKYSPDRMLNAISMVESSGGKNVNHHPTPQGTAYGKFALMPSVIHDTIRLNPDLRREYSKVLRLQGQHLHRFMQDHPQLEEKLAQKHLQRLEHHFGQNPIKISYSWNHGIAGTNQAIKQNQNLDNAPYVQSFKQYYGKGE